MEWINNVIDRGVEGLLGIIRKKGLIDKVFGLLESIREGCGFLDS